jgi:hypothetical protein
MNLEYAEARGTCQNKQTNSGLNKDSSMTSNDDELLYYYRLRQPEVNQETDWDLKLQCHTGRHYYRYYKPLSLAAGAPTITACIGISIACTTNTRPKKRILKETFIYC